MNRIIEPAFMFTRGQGAHIWDVQGRRYVDYHAGFAPHFLGHNFAATNQAVIAVLQSGESLIGAGLSALEGELAELICVNVAAAEKVTFLNTGSEGTSLAIRLSRAITNRSDFIVMQGGYNGNHDELACNVFNTVAEIGPRVSPREYPLRPVGAGTILEYSQHVHAINFNDLESVRYACQRHPIAALITEPVLQNIGVVKPVPGYLEGLRALADEFGFILIFDEVKTGFRHALGGYSEISGVLPDLVVYGKAVANGFPLAILGGKREPSITSCTRTCRAGRSSRARTTATQLVSPRGLRRCGIWSSIATRYIRGSRGSADGSKPDSRPHSRSAAWRRRSRVRDRRCPSISCARSPVTCTTSSSITTSNVTSGCGVRWWSGVSSSFRSRQSSVRSPQPIPTKTSISRSSGSTRH